MIINRKFYSLRNIYLISETDNELPLDDEHYEHEALCYNTRTESYLLFASGGMSSKYSVCDKHGDKTAGSTVVEMTEQQAREWCDQNLPPNRIAWIWENGTLENIKNSEEFRSISFNQDETES